jgi:hypothetical protein
MAINIVLAMPIGIGVREIRLLSVTGQENWQGRTRTIRNAEHTRTTETVGGGRIEISVISKCTAAAFVPVTNIGTSATATISAAGGIPCRGGR